MFRSNEALQAKTGLGFRAAEERAHVHFLGGKPDAELTDALSPAELDALLDEILAIKGDDRETWSAGIEYAHSITVKIRKTVFLIVLLFCAAKLLQIFQMCKIFSKKSSLSSLKRTFTC